MSTVYKAADTAPAEPVEIAPRDMRKYPPLTCVRLRRVQDCSFVGSELPILLNGQPIYVDELWVANDQIHITTREAQE